MATRRGPDNSVRVAISGLGGGAAWANVFWCQLTTSGTPSQTDLDSWLTAFQSAYKTRFASAMSTEVSFTQAQAGLFLPGSLFLPSIVAMTGAGSGSVGTMPPSGSAILSWQTGVYWRGGKPRTYLPYLASSFVTGVNDRLSAGSVTALTTSANGFRTDVNALTSGAISATQLGFVSFQTGGSDRVPPVFFAFNGVKIHPRIGTQRRRLGKWAP